MRSSQDAVKSRRYVNTDFSFFLPNAKQYTPNCLRSILPSP
jgi:hypothetical protein